MLEDVPEIVELVGTASANQVLDIDERDGAEAVKSAVRSVFTHLMSASKEMTTKAISKLKSRLHIKSQVYRNFIIIEFFPYCIESRKIKKGIKSHHLAMFLRNMSWTGNIDVVLPFSVPSENGCSEDLKKCQHMKKWLLTKSLFI